MLIIILLTVILGLCGVFLFLVCPSMRQHPDRKLLDGLYIAHRGLHNKEKGIPENSLVAFKEAIIHGFAIENDIHLTSDGEVVVFHDGTADRMCGVSGVIEEMTLQEIKQLRLDGTNEVVPTLKECLDLVDGQVPLMIEFKCDHPHSRSGLCQAANQILKDYEGKYFIKSFYPQVGLWYKKNRSDILRGQLSGGNIGNKLIHKLLGNLLFNFISRPDFVSYEHQYARKACRRLVTRLGAFPVGWTFTNESDLEKGIKYFSTYVFEGFVPKNGKNNRGK